MTKIHKVIGIITLNTILLTGCQTNEVPTDNVSLIKQNVVEAVDISTISPKKKTTLGLLLSANEAYKMKQDSPDTLFIDVRTRAELNYLGTPTVTDANIPFQKLSYAWNDKKGHYSNTNNTAFLDEMESLIQHQSLTKDAKIILMCRSGKRSAKATNLLAKAGFTQVYSVVDGYEGDKSKAPGSKGKRLVNGWKNNHLPWTYKLDKKLAYEVTKTIKGIDFSKLPSKKQTNAQLYLTSIDAYHMKQSPKDTLFIDVRTRAELNFLGTPVVSDANIPFQTLTYHWNKKKKHFNNKNNPEFLSAIESLLEKKNLNKDAHIILMCRSGSRSAKAANLLEKAGYTSTYTVVDGYEGDKSKNPVSKGQRIVNGWKNNGLPWTYKLTKTAMYDLK